MLTFVTNTIYYVGYFYLIPYRISLFYAFSNEKFLIFHIFLFLFLKKLYIYIKCNFNLLCTFRLI